MAQPQVGSVLFALCHRAAKSCPDCPVSALLPLFHREFAAKKRHIPWAPLLRYHSASPVVWPRCRWLQLDSPTSVATGLRI